MNFLKDQTIQFVITTCISLAGLFATIVFSVKNLPQKSYSSPLPTTTPPSRPRSRTIKGCLMNIVIIIVMLIGIFYLIIQATLAAQPNFYPDAPILFILCLIGIFLCVLTILFALVRIIRGTPLPLPDLEQEEMHRNR